MKELLQPGVSEHSRNDGYYTYMTLSGNSGSALYDLIVARAPVSGIEILDQVAFTASAAMSSDVLINTFGHTPVSIRLDGLELYGECRSAGAGDILAFYAENNAHSNPNARVMMSIGGTTYTCCLLSLRQTNDSTEKGAGQQSGKWTMQLIGVRDE